MASNSSDAALELVAEYSSLILSDRSTVASVALLLWDYALTLDHEIINIWTPRLTGTAAVFLINRYCFLVSTVLDAFILLYPGLTNSTCVRMVNGYYVLGAVASVTSMALFALRIFAIYEQSWLLLGVLGAVGVARVVTGLVRNFALSYPVTNAPTVAGCGVETTNPGYLRFATADVVLILAFDTLVFLLTLYKTSFQVVQARRLKMRNGLAYFLLRDGTLYYLPLVACTAAQVCLSEIQSGNGFAQDIIFPFVSVLQNMLVNRLVLSLRQIANDRTESTIPSIPNLHFATATLYGNIGAPVRQLGEDEDLLAFETESDGQAEKEDVHFAPVNASVENVAV